MTLPAQPSASSVPDSHGFFGHPRGLSTLFLTEFWERFSFYGLRAMVLLFMTATVGQGGLGYVTSKGTAIVALYASLIYLASLPGGWVADHLLGQRRSVFLGGCLIVCGQFALYLHSEAAFFIGLFLNISGTGLLKPNVSTMVGELYPERGAEASARRDAGFSIFYMGINLGAFVAPLVSGWLGERIDWHIGFGSAGIGMLIGVIWYRAGWKHLGDAGMKPNASVTPTARRNAHLVLWSGLALLGLFAALEWTGVLQLTAQEMAGGMGIVIAVIAVVYFSYQIFWGGLDASEKKRMGLIFVLFLFAALFWSGFEQAATSLNLFARDLTDRTLGSHNITVTSLQSVNPAFIILFAPVFAFLWQRMGRRNPSSPTKFSFGLIFLGLGFAVLAFASIQAIGHSTMGPGVVVHRVSMGFLVLTYLFHTFGELCLSPVGLSTVTKLAPHRKVSQMMGIWFMSIALGEVGAGLTAGTYEKLPLYATFGAVAATTIGGGILLLLFVRPLRRLIGPES